MDRVGGFASLEALQNADWRLFEDMLIVLQGESDAAEIRRGESRAAGLLKGFKGQR